MFGSKRHTCHMWLLSTAFLMAVAVAFAPLTTNTGQSVASTKTREANPTLLFAGGFGGGGGGAKAKKGKKKKEIKLKPKQQWDRYLAMKKEEKIQVGVRCKDEDDDAWLDAGLVRSKDGKYTEIGVAKQRALIAEHAIRLYPLQVSAKKAVEWAYFKSSDGENGEWVVVDKSILEDASSIPDGIEKMIGYEGKPDPKSGYYCVYDMGKIKDMQA